MEAMEDIARVARHLGLLRRRRPRRCVRAGDWVIVRTRNSTYSLLANGDGTFDATGGWFSREEQSGARLRVAGCTWGGTAILTRMIAAPGMFLEFANNVRTTRICEVRVLRPHESTSIH